MNSLSQWFLLSCLPLALVGCGGEAVAPAYPVSGKVIHLGKPVVGAIVSFTPKARDASGDTGASSAAGLPASGVTDGSGVYKLTTRTAGDGALPGRYSVTVAKYDKKLEPKAPANSGKLADPNDITNEYPTGYNEMQAAEIAASLSRNILPPRFANPQTSKLETDVVKGDNNFDIKLD